MRDLGLLPAPTYIQNLDHSLLNYLDVQFRRLEENWRILDSSAPSGLSVPAGNVIAGTFGSNVGSGATAYTFRKLTVDDAAVDNFIVQGSGATIRLGSRDSGDFTAMYRQSGNLKFWDSVNAVDRYHFPNTGRFLCGVNHTGGAVLGPWAADAAYSALATINNANASSLAYSLLMHESGDYTYVGGGEIWFRAKNNGATKAVMTVGGEIEFWNHQGGQKHKFWNDGEAWHNSVGIGGDNGYNAGLVSHNGWLRMLNDYGWHTENRGAGEHGFPTFGNQAVETNNNQTSIVARRISQGGWADAGLSSFGESSSMVPYLSMHASGCCTTNWRKDSGASYVVNTNSGGGCDWVYAANHPICSERARKHNISVAEEYGLKTIRGLKPHKFQYTPTSEDEIWAWEKWKHDRAIGIWTVPPSEHMGWDDWHVGYFAEEMVNLVPEVVGLHPDGTPKGIDYGNLVVVAIAAINELADRIEDLEARMYAAA